MQFAARSPLLQGQDGVHSSRFFRVEAPVPVIVLLVVSLVLVLGTLAAFGQNSAHNPSQPAVLEAIPLSDHCPVNLRAEQGMGGQLRNARGPSSNQNTPPQSAGQQIPLNFDPPQQWVGQQIRLTLANTRLTGISGARIKVRGYTPTGRVMPSGFPAPDAAKSLDLILVVGPERDVSTNLRLENFSAVTSIELESVSYADGSRWQASAENRCEIAPDSLMLITSR
jgi:hypothetical protein